MKYSVFSLLYFFIIITLNNVKSQEITKSEESQWLQLIRIEFNGLLPNTSLKESIPIRQTVSNYSLYNNYNESGKITSNTFGQAYAIITEFYNKTHKFGISSGIKYLYYNSDIKGEISNIAEYFYFRYFSGEQETKFARVRNLSENNHYIVIPIDAHIYLLNRKRYGIFTKLGSDLGLNINNKLNVIFFNPEMNPSKNEVLSVLDKTQQKFYATINASIGLRYYYIDKICFNFEIYLLSTLIGTDYFVLSEIKRFSGIRTSVQFPLSLFIKK